MRAFFFGTPQRQLFGAYHPASEDQPPRRSAVLLSGPWLHEYNPTHRVMKNLAVLLAREGFAVLRFDYYGSGDSAGETGEGSPHDHARDFVVAARELLELSGAQTVSAVGRGLGALVAMIAAQELALQHLVAWEPVIRGQHFLDTMAALDAWQRRVRLVGKGHHEMLGYPLSHTVRTALASLDARALQLRLQGRALLVAAQRDALQEELAAHLAQHSQGAELEVVTEDSLRSEGAVRDASVLATRAPQRIAEWLRSVEER